MSCGTCTLCCKVMGVAEIAKPRNTRCLHCDSGVGCRIYEDRPPSCRAFDCVWLQSQSKPGMRLAPDLRPDRSHVVLTATDDGRALVAHVDTDRPQAWKSGRMADFLRSVSRSFPGVLIVIGNRRIFMRDGVATEVASEISRPATEGM